MLKAQSFELDAGAASYIISVFSGQVMALFNVDPPFMGNNGRSGCTGGNLMLKSYIAC